MCCLLAANRGALASVGRLCSAPCGGDDTAAADMSVSAPQTSLPSDAPGPFVAVPVIQPPNLVAC